jgi:curved DNA-binding protein CbpA
VTDYFALLGVPRRPLIDDKRLQENYLRLAAAWHPDSQGGDTGQFRELQEGRRILSEPASRIRHLLDLEGCESKSGGVHGSPELFMEVASVLGSVKTWRRKLAESRSAIGRASLEPERQKIGQRLQQVADRLEVERETHSNQLRSEDAKWPDGDRAILEQVGKKFAFLDRWSKELKESLFELKNAA